MLENEDSDILIYFNFVLIIHNPKKRQKTI